VSRTSRDSNAPNFGKIVSAFSATFLRALGG